MAKYPCSKCGGDNPTWPSSIRCPQCQMLGRLEEMKALLDSLYGAKSPVLCDLYQRGELPDNPEAHLKVSVVKGVWSTAKRDSLLRVIKKFGRDLLIHPMRGVIYIY